MCITLQFVKQPGIYYLTWVSQSPCRVDKPSMSSFYIKEMKIREIKSLTDHCHSHGGTTPFCLSPDREREGTKFLKCIYTFEIFCAFINCFGSLQFWNTKPVVICSNILIPQPAPPALFLLLLKKKQKQKNPPIFSIFRIPIIEERFWTRILILFEPPELSYFSWQAS